MCMKKVSEALSTFVVTAVFMTQKTIQAKSHTDALRIAEETVVEEGATSKNLLNWHAHSVDE